MLRKARIGAGLAAALVLLVLLWGCGDPLRRRAAAMTGGDPDRGPAAIHHYGCEACHSIPGVAGAGGQVGPTLERIGSRPYLAGELPNTPDNLMRWIRDPQGIQPGTPMPTLGVTERDARDIAAYFYTLR
jgi:cytochrome c